MLTLCYSYYNQPEMLKYQFAIWSNYQKSIKEKLKFIIVDDGSKEFPLRDQSIPENLDISLYQINEDIGWNNGGAKNLALYVAKTNWVFVSDLDHVLDEENVKKLITMPKDDRYIYTFKRFYVHQNKMIHKAPNIYMINKDKFWLSGGYDEDFSGYYGYEDKLLRTILEQYVSEHEFVDIYVKIIDIQDGIDDARKSGPFKKEKDIKRNRKLLEDKLQGRIPISNSILRFEWYEI